MRLRINYLCFLLENHLNSIDFKKKALHYANQYDVCCFLDSNNYEDIYSEYDFILAFGSKAELKSSKGDAFDELKHFYEFNKQWLFGSLSYDLKNETEDLKSDNPDQLNFPDLYFFVPEYLIASKSGEIRIILGDVSILKKIKNFKIPKYKNKD
ncbi:MAG: aminodeoxychorismate synthase component I, partial [Flavobacterium sp.]